MVTNVSIVQRGWDHAGMPAWATQPQGVQALAIKLYAGWKWAEGAYAGLGAGQIVMLGWDAAFPLTPYASAPAGWQSIGNNLYSGCKWAEANPVMQVAAKFTPPAGRVIHGMGWDMKYEQPLLDVLPSALKPAASQVMITLATVPLAKGIAPYAGTFLDATLLFQLVEGVGLDVQVAAGQYDTVIANTAVALRDFASPVLLRIGSEFNGSWSGYHLSSYVAAYRRTVDIFRKAGAANVQFCWCYCPGPSDFGSWYPGDDVVDWFGLDVFSVPQFSGANTLAFLAMARDKGRPVSLSESSAATTPIQQTHWGDWFAPYFDFLDVHLEIVKFHYLNADWSTMESYGSQGWKNGNLLDNPAILAQFIQEMQKPKYLHIGELALLGT